MSALKNVVIVGTSAAGGNAAKKLVKSLPSEYRVVIIEQLKFAYWPIGALRAAVQPGFETSVVAEIDPIVPAGSHHILIKGVQVVSLEENAVVLEKPTKDFPDAKVTFERAILALGSTYSFPCRPASSDLETTLDALRHLQVEVKKANSIVILGGGPVGVEFAGEVYSEYPGKKITLITSSKMLIPSMNNTKLHSKLLSQLEKAGVRVLLGDKLVLEDDHTGPLPEVTKLTTESGVEIEADFILNGFGSRPNTDLIKQLDPEAVNAEGFVKVNDDLTIKSKIFSKYFAVGDINELPGGKTYMAATNQVPVAAANIMVDLTRIGSKKKVSPPPKVMAVPLGRKGGAIQLPFATLGEWTVSMIKGKTLFVSNFVSTYK